MCPPMCAYHVPETEYLANRDRLAVFDNSRGFGSCNTSIGLTIFTLERQRFIAQRILFQTWTSAAVTHVKMGALALTR